MQYKSIKGVSGWGQLGILLGFSGAGLILAGLAQVGIGMQLVPGGLPPGKMNEAILEALVKPENVNYARAAQLIGTFFMFFLPAMACCWIAYGKNTFWLGFNRHINALQVITGFFIIFFANMMAQPLSELSHQILVHFPSLNEYAQKLEDIYTDQVKVLSNLKGWGEFVAALFIMAFFPAVFEEVFFRGALQNLFERWTRSPLFALLFASFIFSLIHMSVFLFLSRFVLGIALGLMYQRSKNLWVNIIAHFLNNSMALIQLFWITQHNKKIEVDKLDPDFPLWAGLVAAAFCVGLFILFEKISKRNRKQIDFEEQNLLEQATVSAVST